MSEEKKHPYLVSPGNLTNTVAKFRSSLPGTINVSTLKRLNLAKANEKQVVDILEFIGLVEDGKPTDAGQDIFHTVKQETFEEKLSKQVASRYESLFSDHGQDAWTIEENELVGYFREIDKTSESTGKRQCLAFATLAVLAGKRIAPTSTTVKPKSNSTAKPSKPKIEKSVAPPAVPLVQEKKKINLESSVNVNIQVHIAADTPPATIEIIFQNMGKYLLGNE